VRVDQGQTGSESDSEWLPGPPAGASGWPGLGWSGLALGKPRIAGGALGGRSMATQSFYAAQGPECLRRCCVRKAYSEGGAGAVRGGPGWSRLSKRCPESSTTVLSTLVLDRTDLSIVRDHWAVGGSDSEKRKRPSSRDPASCAPTGRFNRCASRTRLWFIYRVVCQGIDCLRRRSTTS
jgi:hypothetical protein